MRARQGPRSVPQGESDDGCGVEGGVGHHARAQAAKAMSQDPQHHAEGSQAEQLQHLLVSQAKGDRRHQDGDDRRQARTDGPEALEEGPEEQPPKEQLLHHRCTAGGQHTQDHVHGAVGPPGEALRRVAQAVAEMGDDGLEGQVEEGDQQVLRSQAHQHAQGQVRPGAQGQPKVPHRPVALAPGDQQRHSPQTHPQHEEPDQDHGGRRATR